MFRRFATALAVATCIAGAGIASADDYYVTVDPAMITNGYMNVFELPSNGGGFVFGAPWGLADLTAVFSGNDLTLGPNTIGDPNEFWYQCVSPTVPPNCGEPGAPGNKIMEANAYFEDTGNLNGQTIIFKGVVLSNTLTAAHTVVAFVKDYASDYGSFNQSTVALPASGPFKVSLATINDPGRHVQFGFQMTGVNVWVTDVGPYGSVTVGPAEPLPGVAGVGLIIMSIVMLGGGALALQLRRRREVAA